MESVTREVLANCIELLLDAVFLVSPDGKIVYVSPACEKILGYKASELIGQTMIDFVAPEDRQRTQDEANTVMAGVPRIGFENRYIHKDGSYVHLMWSALWSDQHDLRIGVAREVTERKQAEAIQKATYAISEAAHRTTDIFVLFEEFHRILLSLVPVSAFAVAVKTHDLQTLELVYHRGEDAGSAGFDWDCANDACAAVLESGRDLWVDDHAMSAAFATRENPAGYGWHLVPLATARGTIGLVMVRRLRPKAESNPDQQWLMYLCAQIAAAVERMQLIEELYRAARYDELTGLPNRRTFRELMSEALLRARRNSERLALLFVDIDEFKGVNDSHGHATGDALLKEIGHRLAKIAQFGDVVARFAGDEFLILLDEASHERVMAVVAEIRASILRPMQLDDASINVRASVGVAIYPVDGATLPELMHHADKAMYTDKRRSTLRPA